MAPQQGIEPSVGSYRIRPARPSDADSIRRLITSGLGERYLRYTIYQSPRVVHYFEALASRSSSALPHRLHVLVAGADVLGFYHAFRCGKVFFLNNIAVSEAVQGQGLGRQLLEHYECTGRASGCESFALDVFESNRRARTWYERAQYRYSSASFVALFALRELPQVTSLTLQWDATALSRALVEENARGFSRIECRCGPGRLSVGLIAERLCKLLACEAITTDEAVSAIARGFHMERDTIIVPHLSVRPIGKHVLGAEEVSRLGKGERVEKNSKPS